MRHKTTAMILLCVCMALLAAALVLGALAMGGGSGPAEEASAPAADEPAGETTPASEPAPTADAPAPAEASAGPMSTTGAWSGPDVAEQSAAVTAEYFADAGFLGNSVLSRLWYYDNDQLLPADKSHWYWDDDITVLGASPYAAQMADQPFGKIYIELGINELNYDRDALKEAFNTVIDQLQKDHPDAIIYLMSVTPVSKWCNDNKQYKQSGVNSFNEMLRQIAREQKVWYLNVYPVLCGEDGFLPSDVTPDGIHFTAAHYEKWFEYLRTHYVPDGHSPTVSLATPVPSPTEGAELPEGTGSPAETEPPAGTEPPADMGSDTP